LTALTAADFDFARDASILAAHYWRVSIDHQSRFLPANWLAKGSRDSRYKITTITRPETQSGRTEAW